MGISIPIENKSIIDDIETIKMFNNNNNNKSEFLSRKKLKLIKSSSLFENNNKSNVQESNSSSKFEKDTKSQFILNLKRSLRNDIDPFLNNKTITSQKVIKNGVKIKNKKNKK